MEVVTLKDKVQRDVLILEAGEAICLMQRITTRLRRVVKEKR